MPHKKRLFRDAPAPTESRRSQRITRGTCASQCLAIRAMCVMQQAYTDPLPRDFWGLNKAGELLCSRVIILTPDISASDRDGLLTCGRFPVVGIRTEKGFNHSIAAWPRGVRFITFGPGFKHRPMLPDGLEEVTLAKAWDHMFLPGSLKKVVFGDERYPQWDGPPRLPLRVESVKYGIFFNKPLQYLPIGLKDLTLGYDFNSALTLPPRLQRLTLGKSTNVPLGRLPPTLISLVLGDDFNQPLGPLPQGLKKLVMGESFSHAIGDLPPGLKSLTLSPAYRHLFKTLPDSLHTLIGGSGYDGYKLPLPALPPNLHTLETKDWFDHDLGELPPALRKLWLGHGFSQSLEALPPNFHTLGMAGNAYLHTPLEDLPSSLRNLYLYTDGPPEIVGPLPEGLQKLTLVNYNEDFEGGLPSSLISLNLSCSSPCLDPLPPKLIKLATGSASHLGRLPESLRYLSVNEDATYEGPLPPNLMLHTFDADDFGQLECDMQNLEGFTSEEGSDLEDEELEF